VHEGKKKKENKGERVDAPSATRWWPKRSKERGTISSLPRKSCTHRWDARWLRVDCANKRRVRAVRLTKRQDFCYIQTSAGNQVGNTAVIRGLGWNRRLVRAGVCLSSLSKSPNSVCIRQVVQMRITTNGTRHKTKIQRGPRAVRKGSSREAALWGSGWKLCVQRPRSRWYLICYEAKEVFSALGH
jgi:hypothetical protein